MVEVSFYFENSLSLSLIPDYSSRDKKSTFLFINEITDRDLICSNKVLNLFIAFLLLSSLSLSDIYVIEFLFPYW